MTGREQAAMSREELIQYAPDNTAAGHAALTNKPSPTLARLGLADREVAKALSPLSGSPVSLFFTLSLYRP